MLSIFVPQYDFKTYDLSFHSPNKKTFLLIPSYGVDLSLSESKRKWLKPFLHQEVVCWTYPTIIW